MPENHPQPARQSTASSPNQHPVLGVGAEASAATCNHISQPAEHYEHFLGPLMCRNTESHLKICILLWMFSAKDEEWGEQLAWGVRNQDLCISPLSLFHSPTLCITPLQAAVQLLVKELLTSQGCEETYGPIKNLV